MYQSEMLYFEYVILGLPKKCFSFLMKFRLKKRPTPTIYAAEPHFASKFFGLAFFCPIRKDYTAECLVESLKRHALVFDSKKCVLLYNDEFSEFIKCNRETLEKFYLIKKAEDNQKWS